MPLLDDDSNNEDDEYKAMDSSSVSSLITTIQNVCLQSFVTKLDVVGYTQKEMTQCILSVTCNKAWCRWVQSKGNDTMYCVFNYDLD